MAFEAPIQVFSLGEADVDLSTKQFFLAKLDAAGKAVLAGAGDFGLPIQQDPVQDEAVSLMTAGLSKVQAGGVIAVFDLLTSDAAGKAVVAGGGDNIIGRAMLAGAAGDVITYLISDGGVV